jgi:hypothetical protein
MLTPTNRPTLSLVAELPVTNPVMEHDPEPVTSITDLYNDSYLPKINFNRQEYFQKLYVFRFICNFWLFSYCPLLDENSEIKESH